MSAKITSRDMGTKLIDCPAAQAESAEELKRGLFDPRIPKSAREHFAGREIRRLEAVNTDLIAALQMSAELVKAARQHFPKSMHSSDKFQLEQTCAAINSALAKAGAL